VSILQFTGKNPEKRRFTKINVQERFSVFLRVKMLKKQSFSIKI